MNGGSLEPSWGAWVEVSASPQSFLSRHELIFLAVAGEDEIPEINVDLHLLDKLKARIQVARQIDSAQHKTKKENHEKNWLKEAAEAMEIEVDSDLGIRYVPLLLLPSIPCHIGIDPTLNFISYLMTSAF